MHFVTRAFGNFLKIYFYLIVAFATMWIVGLASDHAIQTLATRLHLSFLLGLAAIVLSCIVTAIEIRQLRFARIAASGDPYSAWRQQQMPR